FGIAASMDAIRDAGLEANPANAERIGVCVGSGIGGLPMIEETHNAMLAGGVRKVSPFFVPGSIINMISGIVAINYGFKGPNFATVSACATANH
ncbi:beta-ketoacyl synthase N-terminal-like domain-containing protein, partial [Salmonella enterica]|uniref:beta-ketoacyl synthase N-terminal-like domain-containing protein n=2 Tax=Pseudomonadota TaxID=1224 RepID=UPI002646BD8D